MATAAADYSLASCAPCTVSIDYTQSDTVQANGYSQPKPKAKPRVECNRVLVTGGAGFVGSHLCAYLVKRGDHVSVAIEVFTKPRTWPGWRQRRGTHSSCIRANVGHACAGAHS